MAGNNIASLRKRRGLSQTDLADKVGTSINMLGKLERGARTLDTDWLDRIGKALEVDPRDLIGPVPVPDAKPVVDVPEATTVGIQYIDQDFGLGAMFTDSPVQIDVVQFPKVWVDSITSTSPVFLTWTRGRGDSMEPTIHDGDLVLLDRSKRRVDEQDAMWAFTIGDVGSIKRLRVKGDRFQILSDNPSVPDDEEPIDFVNVVARVIFVGKKK